MFCLGKMGFYLFLEDDFLSLVQCEIFLGVHLPRTIHWSCELCNVEAVWVDQLS